MEIWQLLIQFAFRVTFGVALAMSLTPAKWVTSGFYRVHLWVLMGVNTFAALALITQSSSLEQSLPSLSLLIGLAVGLAVASYIGAVIWLYEARGAGQVALILIAAGGLLGAGGSTVWPSPTSSGQAVFWWASLASSGAVLGITLTAMFLGHWYLNTPTMELRPLRRLVLLMGVTVLVRATLSGAGLGLQMQLQTFTDSFWIFVGLRWLSGVLATLILTLMTWYTLKIPNTQSATGILYAAVILVFIGELTAQLLSVTTQYPL